MIHRREHQNDLPAVAPRANRARSRAWVAFSRWSLLLCVSVWLLGSTGCRNTVQRMTQPIPRALPTSASLTQIIDVVNANSSRVQSLSASRATLVTPGYPSLNANIAFLRPRSFRMVAEKFGPQVDLGSNDELLWMWVRLAQPPALYFCRHDQFANSAARQIIPIEPEWLVEAFGVVTFDPTAQNDGPFPVGKGRVQINSRWKAPGQNSRIVIVDDSRGIVLEEHVYDAQGKRLASAIMSKHVHDPATGATLPRHVEINWPTTNLDLSIDMPDLHINQLTADPRELFTKPVYTGYNEVDLAQPNGQMLVPTADGRHQAQPAVRY